MAEATGNRYKKPVGVDLDWDSSEGAHAALTNWHKIYINAGNNMTKKLPTRQQKLQHLVGLLAHEVGHILFTDFESLNMFGDSIKNGKFWPKAPTAANKAENEALAEIQEVFLEKDEGKRKRALALISQAAFTMLNIMEDVYIEAQMCHRFPGIYKSGIELVQELIFDGIETLSDQMSNENYSPMSIIISIFLQYARTGDFNNPDGLENEYTEALYNCLDYIDNAVYAEDINMRYNAANKIVLNIWPFIKQELENIEDDERSGGSSGGGAGGSSDPDAALKELLEELTKMAKQAGVTSQPQGGNAPIEPDKKNPLPKSRGGKSSADADKEEKGVEPDPASGDSASGDEGSEIEAISEVIGVADCDEEESKVQDVIDEEDGRIPLMKTEDFESDGDGTVTRDMEYKGAGYSSAADDTEKLLSTMAEEKLHKSLDEELCGELQSMADDIRYGNAHRDVNVKIRRMSVVDDELVTQYHQISAPLLQLSRRLQKQVYPILKDRREGGKLTGLLMGKRFSARDSVRKDGRMFYNNRLPSDPMEMAVAVLVDESGSMGAMQRATSARAASIVLYDFCRGLNIPIAVYGHTESSAVEIYAHAEFDTMDKKDRYRLMDISARSNNRDGAALRFTAERLVKRPEPLKLLILISDGQPAGNGGYYGTEAEADLRGVKLEYQRKGIKLFAAAIGDDKENIQRIYGDGFLDITDLNKLPVNLCGLLQRYVKAI